MSIQTPRPEWATEYHATNEADGTDIANGPAIIIDRVTAQLEWDSDNGPGLCLSSHQDNTHAEIRMTLNEAQELSLALLELLGITELNER